MRLPSPTRRRVAVLAASTVGLSTALFTAAGVASATTTVAPAAVTADDDYSAASDDVADPATSVTIRDGFCAAHVDVIGGEGGADGDAVKGPADEVQALIPVQANQVYVFRVGGAASGDTPGVNSADSTANGHTGPTGTGAGGAGSSLTRDGAVVASAKGGKGGTAGGVGGGTTTVDAAHYTIDGVGVDPFTGSTADPTDGTGGTGDGRVEVDVHACDVPYAPNVRNVDARDTSATVEFYPEDGDQLTAAPTGYEYKLGTGDWTAVTTQKMDPADPDPTSERSFTLTGLTTGQAYSVQLRATSQFNGPGTASDAQPFTPTHVVAAPADVHATVGGDTVHLTWEPPAGETGITGYQAWVLPGADPQSDSGLVTCGALDANARSCTLTVAPGQVYSATVVALDAAGERGDWGTVVTDVVPAPSAPATVPAGSGPLSTPTGAPSGLAQGSTVTLTGTGYAPNSTVTLYVYSTPTLLATVVTDGTGSFSKAVTIPAGLAPGAHHLVAAGVDPSGNPRYLTSAVTVAQATGTLAWTGFETLPVLLGGVLAVALGAALLVVTRRRRTA